MMGSTGPSYGPVLILWVGDGQQDRMDSSHLCQHTMIVSMSMIAIIYFRHDLCTLSVVTTLETF